MKKWLFFILATFPFLLTNCSGSKSTIETSPKGVQFEKANVLSDVLDKAEKKNKLVFVDMYTDWCVPCKVMDEEVFTDRQVIELLNDHFISYKVNAEKGNGTNLAFVFQTQVYPTLLFLDANGSVIERSNGSLSQSQLISMANRALASQTN